jgi:phosphopantothenoylcysteine decarboxylase/phosphopantothenate--cysteine ligase
MTAGAREFVTPLTFQAVSGRAVRDELFDSAAEAAMGHIELARWADLIIVAPATADFLARLAGGHADDLLATLCLATDKVIAVAPAMNRLMWANKATQDNMRLLAARGIAVLGPGSGDQACGETGDGRMLEPLEIAEHAITLLGGRGPLSGVRVLVTAGPTREPVDPVRFLSNRSSGKMGFAVAAAARAAGADVVLVAGPVTLATPAGVRRIDVESAADMLAAVEREVQAAQIFIGTAAVADYRPARPAGQKIKKSSAELDIAVERTVDILAHVAARKDKPFVVGFAAETEQLEHYAKTKMLKKNLDMIAANDVSNDKVFERDENALLVLWRNGRQDIGRGPKDQVAAELIALVTQQFRKRADAVA